MSMTPAHGVSEAKATRDRLGRVRSQLGGARGEMRHAGCAHGRLRTWDDGTTDILIRRESNSYHAGMSGQRLASVAYGQSSPHSNDLGKFSSDMKRILGIHPAGRGKGSGRSGGSVSLLHPDRNPQSLYSSMQEDSPDECWLSPIPDTGGMSRAGWGPGVGRGS